MAKTCRPSAPSRPSPSDLLRLLFPGFFDEKLIHSSEIKAETAALLDSILGKLEDEIRKSLEYQPAGGSAKKDIPKGGARADGGVSRASCRGIREILCTDMEAAFNGDPARRARRR